MTSVASNHVPEGLHGLDEQFSEPNIASRFTAVNGQTSPRGADRDNLTNGHDEMRNGAPAATGDAELNDVITVQQSQPAIRQPAQEQPLPPVTDQSAPYNGSRPRSISRSPPSRKRSYPEAFPEASGIHHAPPHVHRTHAEAPEYIRGPPGPYTHAGSKLPPDHEIDQDRAQAPLSSAYDPHAQPSQPYYAQPPNDDPDARLAEALQRENGNGNGIREAFASPDTDERAQYGEYGASRSQMADAERKRRKRVFSNRTKTGCMTCRKRKKKCDELHPECKYIITVQQYQSCEIFS